MTPQQLQEWLTQHEVAINDFMDYEFYVESPEELISTIGMWTQNDNWNDDGTQFISLGADGTGSMFVVWLKPGTTTGPVAFFGSEGSRGVLTKSPEDWARALAFGPGVDEDWEGEDTKLDPESMWIEMMEEDDPDAAKSARTSLEAYRAAVEAKFGTLPAFDELTNDLETLRTEFSAWLESKTA